MRDRIMSKSSGLDKVVKLYIIDAIDPNYVKAEENNIIELINGLKTSFYAEYGFMVDKVGEQKALAEWLQGLPSAVSIDFYNHHILELAVKWGSIPEDATERQEDKILDNWFNFIANKITQLFHGYRVPKA